MGKIKLKPQKSDDHEDSDPILFTADDTLINLEALLELMIHVKVDCKYDKRYNRPDYRVVFTLPDLAGDQQTITYDGMAGYKLAKFLHKRYKVRIDDDPELEAPIRKHMENL